MRPYYERAGITLYCGDNRDVLPGLDAGSVAAVITDPPYGCGLETWDTAPDMDALCAAWATLRPSFVAVFCQMPFLLDVAAAAQRARWHYCEHIAWVKRNTTPAARLSRSHESILIYAPGKARRFYQTEGPYEDVRLPGVLVDTISLTSVHRQIGFMRQQIERGGPALSRTGASVTLAHKMPERLKENGRARPNYTNVWSFLPPNLTDKSKRPEKLVHVSMKPAPVCARLIEMLTPPEGVALDPFAGSGSTLVAAAQLGRSCTGIELEERYCEIAARRIDAALDAAHQLAMTAAD